MNKLLQIVTICMNNPEDLGITLHSVASQETLPTRHIVVDSSDDGHSKIMRQLSQENMAEYFWCPPKGIYQAMNFGISKLESRGLCMFLNAGDYLATPDVVTKIFGTQLAGENSWPMWAIGTLGISGNSRPADQYALPKTPEIFSRRLKAGKIWLPHPSTVYRVGALGSIGYFEERLVIAADYLFGLRMFQKFGTPEILPFTLAVHQMGGVSSVMISRGALESSRARIRVFGKSLLPQESFRVVRIFAGACRRWLCSRLSIEWLTKGHSQ